jgi:4-aminobutyrate aminotransferase-like enzyme
LVFGVSTSLLISALKAKAQLTLDLLRAYESRNVTLHRTGRLVAHSFGGARVAFTFGMRTGKKYLDLTAAFGVAAAGHANPASRARGQKQMATLLHAMGDVHPHALKAQLARELSAITFERWNKQSPNRFPLGTEARTGKAIFCNSGFEAVEAALKTAMLATGKRGVIAFEGAYHGLGYGALNATHRGHFRAPFARQLGGFAEFVPFPKCSSCECRGRPLDYCHPVHAIEARIKKIIRQKPIGAILVEPVQIRGGIHIPDIEFLNMLGFLREKYNVPLIVDEIYTGFGRTGRWFACEHSAVVPDIICLGKALTGGFPLSACVGGADLMDAAWPPSTGEAIHTSTFLGHPVGCAMALANINEIRRAKLGRAQRSPRRISSRNAAITIHAPRSTRHVSRPRSHGGNRTAQR